LSPTIPAEHHHFIIDMYHNYVIPPLLLIKLLCHQIILLLLLLLHQRFIVRLGLIVSYLTSIMLTDHINVSYAKNLCMVYADCFTMRMITYQNHCYYSCNHKFFGPIRTTPPEPDSAVAHSIMKLSANPTSDALVAPQISTSLPDSIGRLLMHSSGTSIPVFLIQEPQCQPFWKVRV
jgi:hypothetical protein